MLTDVQFLSSTMEAAHHTMAISNMHMAGIDNPIGDIIPNFTVFGADFTRIWQKIAGGLWAAGILLAIGYLGHGILGIAQSRNGGHPGSLKESKKESTNAGIALGGLIALAPIVSVFIAVFS